MITKIVLALNQNMSGIANLLVRDPAISQMDPVKVPEGDDGGVVRAVEDGHVPDLPFILQHHKRTV